MNEEFDFDCPSYLMCMIHSSNCDYSYFVLTVTKPMTVMIDSNFHFLNSSV